MAISMTFSCTPCPDFCAKFIFSLSICFPYHRFLGLSKSESYCSYLQFDDQGIHTQVNIKAGAFQGPCLNNIIDVKCYLLNLFLNPAKLRRPDPKRSNVDGSGTGGIGHSDKISPG